MPAMNMMGGNIVRINRNENHQLAQAIFLKYIRITMIGVRGTADMLSYAAFVCKKSAAKSNRMPRPESQANRCKAEMRAARHADAGP